MHTCVHKYLYIYIYNILYYIFWTHYEIMPYPRKHQSILINMFTYLHISTKHAWQWQIHEPAERYLNTYQFTCYLCKYIQCYIHNHVMCVYIYIPITLPVSLLTKKTVRNKLKQVNHKKVHERLETKNNRICLLWICSPAPPNNTSGHWCPPLAPSQVVCRLNDDCLSGQTSCSVEVRSNHFRTQLKFCGTMSCRWAIASWARHVGWPTTHSYPWFNGQSIWSGLLGWTIPHENSKT